MKYVARWNETNYQVFTSMDYACEFAREASRKYNTDGIVIEVWSDAFDFIRYGPTYTNGLRADSGWEAPEEKRCCETCGYSRPPEGGSKFYCCLAPIPDCVTVTRMMLPHMGETCPVWRPRV